MAQSMYFIVDDVSSIKQMFQSRFQAYDVRIIIGELQTHHIYVANPPKTSDGRYIFEVPATLEDWQTEILNSPYAGNLKTAVEIEEFISKEIS
jgi:hypothetical protein